MVPNFITFCWRQCIQPNPKSHQAIHNEGLTEEQRILNYRLFRARNVSENAFVILPSKFRVFHTTLCVKPEIAISLVHAGLVLYNFLIKKYPSVYILSGSLHYEKEDGEVVSGDCSTRHGSYKKASQVGNLLPT